MYICAYIEGMYLSCSKQHYRYMVLLPYLSCCCECDIYICGYIEGMYLSYSKQHYLYMVLLTYCVVVSVIGTYMDVSRHIYRGAYAICIYIDPRVPIILNNTSHTCHLCVSICKYIPMMRIPNNTENTCHMCVFIHIYIWGGYD